MKRTTPPKSAPSSECADDEEVKRLVADLNRQRRWEAIIGGIVIAVILGGLAFVAWMSKTGRV